MHFGDIFDSFPGSEHTDSPLVELCSKERCFQATLDLDVIPVEERELYRGLKG
jgi:hypothetical protein